MLNSNSSGLKSNFKVDSLVSQAAGGDTEAFGQLYDIFADRIYRHIYYRTSSVEDARDMTQEVFVRAWKNISRYRKTNTPFLGWLFTISHNLVIDYYRARKDYTYINDEITMDDPDKSPEKMLEARFTQQEIRQAILKLPYEQQQVILMSFIEGFDYSEIATALSKSEGNIRVIVHRALKKMRDLLGKED